jgi:GNAT superfamily N-acetyltransferase
MSRCDLALFFREGVSITEWNIDHYKTGDELQILELFRQAFGEERSLALWQWRYGELPGATENILLVKDDRGEVCGHYAALPFALSYRGRKVPGALRIDFMVHPDRQRMGIGGLLIDAMRQHIGGRVALGISFPNTKSTGPTIKKGPHYLGEAPLYWRLEGVSPLLRGLGRARVPLFLVACANAAMRAFYRLIAMPALLERSYGHAVERAFGEREIRQAEYLREECGIYFIRDETFLCWRFDRHPEIDYTIIFLEPKGRVDATAGYIVLAVKEYQGYRIGFIVDILVHPLALRPARYLLCQATGWFKAQRVETISCMMTGINPYTRALRSLGFMRVPNRFMPRDLNLSFRVFDPDIDHDYAADPDNWILTWADTDLA